MIPEIRAYFNQTFNPAAYQAMVQDIHLSNRQSLDFRISETPLFLSDEISQMLIDAANSVVRTIQTREFLINSTHAIPPGMSVSNQDDHPHFLQIDFAICKSEDGKLLPQLIELQGFPSLYMYQHYLDTKIRQYFSLPPGFQPFYSGLDTDSYKSEFGKFLLSDSAPENVVILEYKPHWQKTRIDFYITEAYYGIKPVCVTEVYKKGRKLFYRNGNREIHIERIYHRFIFDEIIRHNVQFGFDWTDPEVDVYWIGHPNWFYRISKHSLPMLSSKYVPNCYYLHRLDEYPDDLENYVLKPLFSFAGAGVEIEVTRERLDSITNRENFILQKRVHYSPVVETPDVAAMAEVRMMFIWDDEAKLVNNLLRMSKGKMMGVDYNKNQTWVGSSVAYHRT